jgi:predicted dehydrogenase
MSDGITRRKFLAAAAATGAGLALGGGVFAESKSSSTVRVGVIGVGGRGTDLTGTLLSFPYVQIPAICDIDKDAAKRAQDLVESKTSKRPAAYTRDETDYENLCTRDDLDAIIIATPWEWHARMAIAGMRAKKCVGSEVPACMTMQECRDLIATAEETGTAYMMLENVTYYQNVLAVTRMIREGVFGEMLHAEAGYQHDCRFLAFLDNGTLTWRGRHMAEKNGNLYPTHPIGPVARWLNINRGDRFVRLTSMSTKSRGLRNYASQKFGPDHLLAKRKYALGDTNTTLLETANGSTVTLYFDLCTPRPYDLIFRVQGTKATYEGNHDAIHLAGTTPEGEWEKFGTYQEKYEHPIWRDLSAEAVKTGGHGGGDYIEIHEFLDAVRNRTRPPIDVYDAVTWSAIVPLSIESVAKHGQVLDFPDFTEGKWKTNPVEPIGKTSLMGRL